MANKSKAAKRARKVESEAEAWKASSKTVLGRLTYRLEDLPDILILRVAFKSMNASGEYDDTVYNRKFREPAWAELRETYWPHFKDITAVDKNPDRKSHEWHLIMPNNSNKDEFAMSTLLGQFALKTKLPGHVKTGLPERKMACRITSTDVLTSTDPKHRRLYQRSLNILIQRRYVSVDGFPDNLWATKEQFRKIPEGINLFQGEKSIQLKEEKSNMPKGDVSITPLVKGYKAHTINGTQTPSPYSLRVRAALSTDLKDKLIHLVFDLTSTTPEAYNSVYEMLLDVFGDEMNKENISRLQPAISDLLVGVKVQRNYPSTRSETTADVIKTWDEPFLIREVVSNQDTEVRAKTKSKRNDEDEKEVQTSYEYFKENYNDGNAMEHQYLPLVGDGRGAYFPLTHVKFPKKTQVFPKTASVLAQPLRAKIHELGLLKSEGSELVKLTGDDGGIDTEPFELLKQVGTPSIEMIDPLDLAL
ncbi:uncharacterized protein J4E78_001863 [Alternaria triticimaculans]|uniref:uncharacterized protein n=1 Tax=Alternaria triticimaculans TaxID=297637 RepID=UPI0020C2C3A7|nr:uncharacterized protein J4E78_001863 [Alternaria triticimaculans]KAI4668042.1 hypothetical protein J4E78_001863 [Alternaria triticimaculans]